MPEETRRHGFGGGAPAPLDPSKGQMPGGFPPEHCAGEPEAPAPVPASEVPAS